MTDKYPLIPPSRKGESAVDAEYDNLRPFRSIGEIAAGMVAKADKQRAAE